MAASGLGVTVLPALYLVLDVGGSAGIAVVDVKGWQAHRSIALAWRRGSSMEAAYRLIAENVRDSGRRMLDEVRRLEAS